MHFLNLAQNYYVKLPKHGSKMKKMPIYENFAQNDQKWIKKSSTRKRGAVKYRISADVRKNYASM